MDEPQAGDMAKLQAAMIEPQTTYDTGHTREQELAQLRAELQVKCQELADVEVERAVTVLELEKARARAGCYLYRAERVEAELQAARESRRRLVCLIRGEGGGHDTDTETITA